MAARARSAARCSAASSSTRPGSAGAGASTSACRSPPLALIAAPEDPAPARRASGAPSRSTTWGATLITARRRVLLIWVSFAGNHFAWISWQTAVDGGRRAAAARPLAILGRVNGPPSRSIPLSCSATAPSRSPIVGQPRGRHGACSAPRSSSASTSRSAAARAPRMSGLLTIPMMAGVLLSSTVVGPDHHPHRADASATCVAGSADPGRAGSPCWAPSTTTPRSCARRRHVHACGPGVGMTMQNLVLAVQNTVAAQGARRGQLDASRSSAASAAPSA